jgi:S-formylglutathione hydrolase FrmB
MALQFRYRYGFAASLSGYFSPYKNKLGSPPKWVNPFGTSSTLRIANTPIDEIKSVAAGARLPLFWLGAGLGSRADTTAAQYFAQELQLHEADVPLVLTPGGGHTMGTWHAEVPPMLTWMTQGLATNVAHIEQLQLEHARAEHKPAQAPQDPPPTAKSTPSNTPSK